SRKEHGNNNKGTNASHPQMEKGYNQEVMPFSVPAAKAFIAQNGWLMETWIAPSFGGVESIVDQPAIMSYWDLRALKLKTFKDLKADVTS
ncbi:hypothetical protein Tco_0856774, partial [Tanacetum coccineum]